jgi:hypothetical protein
MKTKPPKVPYRVGSIWLYLKEQKYYVLEGYYRTAENPHVWGIILSERGSPDSNPNLEVTTPDPKGRIIFNVISHYMDAYDKLNLWGYSLTIETPQTMKQLYKFVSEGPFEVVKEERLSLPQPVKDV